MQTAHKLPRGCRVLLVKLSSLGDLFHALPLANILEHELDATVDWVTQPEYKALASCFTNISEVITFPRKHFLRGLAPYLRAVRRTRYDVVLDAQGLLKSAIAARLARSARYIGPAFHREGARVLYHEQAGTRNKQRHAVEELLDMATHLGLPNTPVEFPLEFPVTKLYPGPSPKLGILPCSRWPSKNASPEVFKQVLQPYLRNPKECTLYALGAREDLRACEHILRHLKHPHAYNLAGYFDLPELGGIIQQLDEIITVDSGPMHMAAALGKKVTALFGPTEALRTGPYGTGHTVLARTDLPCRPCFARHCPQKHHACLKEPHPYWAAAHD